MPSPIAIVTGFYRYSDIYYEWHKSLLDRGEVSALKAFVSNSSLVDPSNPLRKAGLNGIELFLGTMPSGQARLLFSSAQIEYIRYWLHAMGFTKSLIPLPSSDYLLTDSTLRNWSPVIYKDAAELKKALKVVDKNNKRLKGTDSSLMSIRQSFERIRICWGKKAGVWIAIDFEAWEMDHTVLTEFGWSSVQWVDGEKVSEDGHLIHQDHVNYRNGKYVSDFKDLYKFGDSVKLKKTVFKSRICDMIAKHSTPGPLFLVFHDSSQDMKYLKSLEAPLTGLTYLLPDTPPDEGIFVVDTSDMFAALEGEAGQRTSFDRMCKLLKIPTQFLHNAGNDAHYTLMAMMDMASGNQLDIQREERWPNQTEAAGARGGMKVEFQPWEEESDFSDTEGIVFPRTQDNGPNEEPEPAAEVGEEMMW